MMNEGFVLFLAIGLGSFFAWAFRALPGDGWQMLAATPVRKDDSGQWQGLNLTYYGFFQACSNTLGVLILLLLLGSIGVPALHTFLLTAIVFLVCWPSSRLIARVVEKKKYTFTIGGAFFVGVLLTPVAIFLINTILETSLGARLPLIPTLAATAVAYAFGEGVGRLACISFGCCYGKNIAELSPRFQRWLESFSFVFNGETKKISYEGRLEGVPVAPLQAITAVLFTLTALAGTYLFLKSYFPAALLLTIVSTQGWRFLSEFLRADNRGPSQTLSAYQGMAVINILYTGLILLLSNSPAPATDIRAALISLWDPAVIFFCQSLWLAIFLITGRSKVTGSTLRFFVHEKNI